MSTKPLDRLMFMQGEMCFFCKQPLSKSEASVEHLLALANGGSNSDENCVACCKSFNQLLGSMSLKDKFQVVLNQQGMFICPAAISARKTSVAKATEIKGNDKFDMVVANLKQRGSSRPRRLKTLKSTITSLYPTGLKEAELAAIIQQLQVAGYMTVTETKVSYTL